jgi:hypothetical protein
VEAVWHGPSVRSAPFVEVHPKSPVEAQL